MFSFNGKEYHLVRREAWEGSNIAGGVFAGTGTAWAYIFQAQDGNVLAFVVQYPFTIGKGINTNYGERDLKIIQKAVETDPEGVQQRGRRQYEISAMESPYKEIVDQMP